MKRNFRRPGPSARIRRRLRLIVRSVVALVLVVVLGLAVTMWVLTRSSFIVSRATPVLEALLGGEVTIREASYEGEGRFVFRDFSLRVRGLAGPAGEVLRIGVTELDVDVDRLYRGDVVPRNVTLDRVRVRISEQRNANGLFNFADLTPAPRDGADTMAAPRVEIKRVEVEAGVHDDVEYERRGSRTLAGSLRPDPDGDGLYKVTLVEVGPGGTAHTGDDIRIDGTWDAGWDRYTVDLRNVELNQRSKAMCPEMVRLWWDEMDIFGRMAGVHVEWSREDDYRVVLELEDVGVTLPVDTVGLWARYRSGQVEELATGGRMHVEAGSVELTPTRVTLNGLRGELISAEAGENATGVPYEVSMTLSEIAPLDWSDTARWMEDVLATAPFRMTLHSDEFRVARSETGEPGPVELPLAFARALERFRFTDWVVSTDIVIERDRPGRDEHGRPVASPIRTKGTASIREGAVTYEKFKYRLEDVEAFLELDDDRVTVQFLRGVGSQGATMLLTGEIDAISEDSSIALRLSARGLPVDDRLREALTPGQQQAFDSLMHRRSFDALADARLLTAADDFAPGGLVDLDLQITRTAGQDSPALTTGRVTVHRLGVLFKGFPYPLLIEGGTLQWSQDEIRVAPDHSNVGLPVTVPGGGRGHLRGAIRIERGADEQIELRPELTLTVEGDTISELLLAAIPPTATERAEWGPDAGWPGRVLSRGGRWLGGLRAAGKLDYEAALTGEPGRPFEYEIRVELNEGRAEPAVVIAEMLGNEAIPEPDAWQLHDCRGRITIRRDVIVLDEFAGDLFIDDEARGHISMDGRIGTSDDSTDLELTLRLAEAVIRDEIADLLPPLRSGKARAWFDELQPEGTFDAELEFVRRHGQTERLELILHPRTVRGRLGGTAIVLTHEGGRIRVTNTHVHFEGLRLGLHDGQAAAGTLALAGALPIAAGGADEAEPLTLTWTGGDLGTPLMPGLIRRLRGDEEAVRYESFHPSGSFDATLRYRPGAGDRASSYELRVDPHAVRFRWRDELIDLTLEDGSAVNITPGRIELVRVRASHPSGVLAVSGEIRTDGGIEADIDCSFDGWLAGREASVFLPAVVQRTVRALEIREGRPSRIEGGVLRFRRREGADGEEQTETSFTGRLHVEDLACRAGIRFTDVDGMIDIDVGRRSGEAPWMDIRPRLKGVRLLGQNLRAVAARLTLSDDGRRVHLDRFRATTREGAVTADAQIGLARDRNYSVSVQLANVLISDFMLGDPSARNEEPDHGPEPTMQPDPPPVDPNQVYGGLFGRLTLSGRRGEPGSRVGRGIVRVMQEGLVAMPLALRLLQVFHATIPVGQWDYANARFFIAGDRLVFEDILFESSLNEMFVQHLIGAGELDLDTFELLVRFRSRGGVLLVRDVVGAIGDQLAIIEVTGPLWDPQPRVIGLPAVSGSRAVIPLAPPARIAAEDRTDHER